MRHHQFSIFFFFNDTATTEIYTLSLHDALPICAPFACALQSAAHWKSSPASFAHCSSSGRSPTMSPMYGGENSPKPGAPANPAPLVTPGHRFRPHHPADPGDLPLGWGGHEPILSQRTLA